MGRTPNYLELSLFSVMWREHCGYKNSRPLLGCFPNKGPRVLQGPGENAGVIEVGDGWALAFKMESHNHPSAVEPYEGAATGVGCIIRDVLAMGARPVRSEEHTSELQSRQYLVCRLLLEKKKTINHLTTSYLQT